VRLALMAASFALAACAGPAHLSTPTQPAESVIVATRPLSHPLLGQPLPSFRLAREDGESLSDTTLRGRWTVIAFTGGWCPDCRTEAPYLAALGSAVDQDPALDIIAVHVDARYGPFLSARDFFDKSGIRAPVAIDADRDAYRALQMSWIPSYLVVDPQGVVRGFRTDLSADTSSEGGVKRFIKDIAILRGATPDR